MDIALVTYRGFPALAEDDRALIPALRDEGLTAEPAIWTDPKYPWSDRRVAVIRSTWDYHRQVRRFLQWCDHVGAETLLLNLPAVIRWNSHKFYLKELSNRGVPIVPTEFVGRQSGVSLDSVCRAKGWTETVVKPAVSAAADRTLRVPADGRTAGEAHLAGILVDGDALIQPFLPTFPTQGERSLVFVEGGFSHAVRRPPEMEPGNTQVLPNPITPTPLELALARRVIDAAGVRPVFARVDLVTGLEGEPCLSELELIEPALFLSSAPGAAVRLARAIAARLAVSDK